MLYTRLNRRKKLLATVTVLCFTFLNITKSMDFIIKGESIDIEDKADTELIMDEDLYIEAPQDKEYIESEKELQERELLEDEEHVVEEDLQNKETIDDLDMGEVDDIEEQIEPYNTEQKTRWVNNFEDLNHIFMNSSPGDNILIILEDDIDFVEPLFLDDNRTIELVSLEGWTFTLSQNGKGRHINIQNGQLTLQHIILDGGDQTSGGGGVQISGADSRFIMDEGSMIRNCREDDGGGVFVERAGSFVMNGGTIEENRAINGGGIAVNNGSFLMQAGVIQNNEADRGGGIRLVGGGFFKMTNNAMIQGNSANLTGGGVSLMHGDFEMHSGAIVDNEADMGGGINIAVSGSFLMENGAILRNIARQGGGARAEGVGTIEMMNGRIQENIATQTGGGLIILGRASFIMHDGVIGGSRVVEGNEANIGGGVAVGLNGYFKMEDGQVQGNRGIREGGGVMIGGSAAFLMEGGIISSNSAPNGGGIFKEPNGEIEVKAGTLERNRATHDGGGIFTENYYNLTTSDEALFIENEASSGFAFMGDPANYPNIQFSPASVMLVGNHPLNNHDINYVDTDINITVKHIDNRGDLLESYTTSYRVPYGSYLDIINHVQDFENQRAAYYMIEGGEVRYSIGTLISTVSDKTILIYYGSSIIDVVVPEVMEFRVTEQTGGVVTSGEYEFINHSDLPIQVDFQELRVEEQKADGVHFVSEASHSGEIHLNLYGSSGFACAESQEIVLQGIEPNKLLSYQFGTLGGGIWDGRNNTGIIRIGGRYRGSIPAIPLKPQVDFIFYFEIQ